MILDRLLPRRVAVSAAVAAVVLAGCTSSGSSGGSGGSGGDNKQQTRRAAIAVTLPAADGKVTVRMTAGRLTSVEVTADSPGRLPGRFTGDRDSWTSSRAAAPGVTYRVTARGTADDGERLTERSSFTTAEPERSFIGEYLPDKGTTVGVGMPVSIVFNQPIQDKAEVERHLSVTASPAVEGAWSWMENRDGRDRVDFRPRTYWRPGTAVTLRMSLDGIDAGGGLYGTQDRVVNFRVGTSVVSTVDTAAKTLTLRENGKVLRTLPVSTGKPGFETWNGTMVVLGKVPSITKNSRTVSIFGSEAYNLKDVKWDVQLTPSGTYVHAAPWNEGKFGRVNGSHGCIGMSTSDAQWFYDHTKTGDVVTVVNSKDTVAVSNGYGDWNVSWERWQAGSALSAQS